MTLVNYRHWQFQVDKELTETTYANISNSGTMTCNCNDCKNYIAFRDKVFPDEVKSLFVDLGIDYRKEVEIFSYQTTSAGLHHIWGWFHFKGHNMTNNDNQILTPTVGHIFGLTEITDNFYIGFSDKSDITCFDCKTNLIQIDFETYIPWVIDKSLEIIN